MNNKHVLEHRRVDAYEALVIREDNSTILYQRQGGERETAVNFVSRRHREV